MAITQSDARQALADIQRTEARGAEARLYRSTGSILILWGLIWVTAYTATGLLPTSQWWVAWVPGDLIGLSGTLLLYPRTPQPGVDRNGWLIGAASVCFIGAIYVVDPPTRAATAEVLPALLVGFLYVVLGARRMQRFVPIGALLFASALAGFFAIPHYLPFWLAAVGGGTLLTGGAWLRRA